MKKSLLAISVMVILLFGLVACSASQETSRQVFPAAATPPLMAPATTTIPGLNSGPSTAYSGENSATSTTPTYWGPAYTPQSTQSNGRMVVRNGNMQMVVADITSSLNKIAPLASQFGGYIVSSREWKEGQRNMGNISFRVLAENYDEAMAALRAMAMSVTSETTSSQDVTEEYVDLGSKLKNLEATEAQLLKIMESATKIEDILSIQQQLTSVQGNIEQTKGRMQYLEQTSATSLIEVTLNEAAIAIQFNSNKVSADTGDTIRFTSEVSGGFAPYHFLWDFGDGKTSTDISPTHSYQDAGIYTVTLKVIDDKGYTDTLTRSAYINIIGSWQPGGVASSAWNGFTALGRVMVNILIWLGVFSPVWIVIGGIIWLVIWRKRQRTKVRGKPL